MKAFLGEILDPVKDFYKIRNMKEKLIIILVPLIIGVASGLLSFVLEQHYEIDKYAYVSNIVNQFITILSLFVSFNMGYLSLILTSNSKNVEEMKTSYSNSRFKDDKGEKPFSVYEILTAEITYTIIVEILFLIGCVAEKVLLNVMNGISLRIMLCIDILIFVHIVIMLLIIVKNIYFSFWKA